MASLAPVTVLLGLGACGSSYYLVKDPHTGHEYYTTAVARSSGGIRFRDGKTQSSVMLPSRLSG
jgi:hypothetical protein